MQESSDDRFSRM